MSDSIREAAERLMRPEPVDDGAGMWKQAKRITADYQEVARHVLAETDPTPATADHFRLLGFVEQLDRDDGGAGTVLILDRGGEMVADVSIEDGEPTFLAVGSDSVAPMILTDPTVGQVLTALRLFGIPVKRNET